MRRPNNDTWVVGAYAATLVAACITSLAIMILGVLFFSCCHCSTKILEIQRGCPMLLGQPQASTEMVHYPV